MKRNVILVVGLIVSVVLLGQGLLSKKFSPNIRMISMLKSEDDGLSVRFRSLSKTKAVEQNSYVNAFIRLKDGGDLDSLEAAGVIVNSKLNNIVTAMIPIDSVSRLGQIANVKRVEMGIPVFMRMNKARIAANVDSVLLGASLNQAYKGKGVVVGIVDNGFQYGHVNFYNSTQDTLRVKRVWDQNLSTGTEPTNYSYGSEFKTSSSILSAAYDNKTETHATHVAGIAAGGDIENSYYGVAPEADLVFVSYSSTSNTGILDGIKYVYDYATEVSKPAVVNLSLGSHIGPHDGTSTFDQACDELQGAGRLLVGAAGNEGADSLYIRKSFTSSTDTLKTLFAYTDTTEQVVLSDIWSGAGQSFKIAVGIYDSSTKKYIYKSDFVEANTTGSIYYEASKSTTNSAAIYGYLYVGTELNADNNKSNAYIQSELNNLSSNQHVCVFITASSGYIDAWSETYYCAFNPDKLSGWTTGSSSSSVGEIGGTGTKIITVGAFSTKKQFTNISNTSYSSPPLTVGDITYFSSKGPTADDRMKPDITAPGALIASSFSSAVANTSTYYSNLRVGKTTFNSATYYYGIMQGTSMASPFVAGVLATWLQANPDLTPAEVRSIFQQTAINDSYTGTVSATGSNTWGYGKIDAWNGIKQIIATTGVESTTVGSTSGLFSLTKSSKTITLSFLQDVDGVVVSIYSLTGKEMYRNSLGSVTQGEEGSFVLNSLSDGIYILRVVGKNSLRQNMKIIL
ncbi:MAG: hypothetical protein H6Q14_1219 [Bacteroidetes bacterium]|nr:hypothetical protein [Bacteroidota bacterium]